MTPPSPRAGNILIYLLGAIFLLGILLALLRGSFQEGSSVDSDKLSLKVSEVQRYAAEMARGVNYILQNGAGESQLLFAVPTDNSTPYGDITTTPSYQLFSPRGGGVEYKTPSAGINDGTAWQFFGTTHIEDMGTDTHADSKAELIAVLPNVTESFCLRMNLAIGQAIDLEEDTDDSSEGCVYEPGSEFSGTYASGTATNLLTSDEIPRHPATELCVRCSTGDLHYYRVLLGR